jgi:dienelactone hydrolase
VRSHRPAIHVIVALEAGLHVRGKEVLMSTIPVELESTATRIPIGGRIWLTAEITTPPDAMGLVLFAHGSGSSRLSPRNQFVAAQLNVMRMATLLADLLTEEEEKLDERTRELRFDIPMLTHRVVQLIDWAKADDRLASLPLGLFGASTGAAAALDAAANRPEIVEGVVARGGRPDLASQLRFVRAPALLIVGGKDTTVLQLNTASLQQLACTKEKKLEVISGATHLFEEPRALEAVASAASAWFRQFLAH